MKITIQLGRETATMSIPIIVDNNYTIDEVVNMIGYLLTTDIKRKIDKKFLKSNTIKDLLG